jgi:hypothetical protein
MLNSDSDNFDNEFGFILSLNIDSKENYELVKNHYLDTLSEVSK